MLSYILVGFQFLHLMLGFGKSSYNGWCVDIMHGNGGLINGSGRKIMNTKKLRCVATCYGNFSQAV